MQMLVKGDKLPVFKIQFHNIRHPVVPGQDFLQCGDVPLLNRRNIGLTGCFR